ncbi:hypothetical protein IWW57_006709 [Coemansia sp. S610]|uniref:Uncharacterized protein n=1 Tax=Coemansia linderi TaxID=2663919 RepID=A0ACC1KEY1_9FUNG|nr:hypothetical protein LPJ60_005663 [Coemansia sp. RSA 2675]KAJ2011159.1 hypothetical protein IWW57_006709 [Coemansia sp. S610]KAJ2412423.1 hypothetical protein GGI10_003691 [Coemansia sp. RSA 2530]KAJ2698082.1 hypothetical protein H4218_003530 [Coemansia sp. IMI 209128]KAJ2789071.1 hypothetical protein GGI18_002608 [Coemansia linderi]
MFRYSIAAILAACLLGVQAMNITCASFDTLPILTYDNVAPQALQQVVIAFKPGTSSQILDSFRDALQCRGAAIDPPNYNTLTLTGFTSLVFATDVQASKTVAAVEVNGQVTTLQHPSSTSSSAKPSSTKTTSSATSTTGSPSSRPVVNSDFGLGSSESLSSSESSSGSTASVLMNGAAPFLLALAAIAALSL